MTTLRILLISVVLATTTLRAEENLAANQNTAIAACKAFAEAEEIYHRTDWDADGILEYAQSIHGGKRVPMAPPDPEKLPKPTAEESAQIAKWIKNFGSDEFAVRESAAGELRKLGPKAYAQVQAAQISEKDPEIVTRCRALATQLAEALAPERKIDMRGGLLVTTQGEREIEISLVDRGFANAECPLGTDPATVTAKSGYVFRVLTRQGKSAVGGERDFTRNGNMILGYGLLAFPKEYGVSGKECFMISNMGTIFQRDFGSKEKTEAFAKECNAFDPVQNEWVPTE